MPLIIITGLPCSGKTHRAQQIAADLENYIASSSSSDPVTAKNKKKKTVQIIPSQHASADTRPPPPQTQVDDSGNHNPDLVRDQIYNNATREKTARAAEFSAIKRAVSRDNIVIADGLNYIKGYRYQLWCEAKAAGTRCCVVQVAAQEEECKKWNRERQGVWGRQERDEKGKDGDDEMTSDSNTARKRNRAQGESVLGDLVPESHTAIYGDRIVENSSLSRSSSMDGFDNDRDDDDDDDDDERPRPRPQDTMTLKSLYISDRPDDDSKTEEKVTTTNNNIPTQPGRSSSCSTPPPSTNIIPPSPETSQPYSSTTLKSLTMRYEPPSPFSRWDTPLFTIPSTDVIPPSQDIWTALFPPPTKPASKKAPPQRRTIPDSANSTSTVEQQQQQDENEDENEKGEEEEEVKRHAATILPKATGSDALQILENTTMEVVKHLLMRARETGVADVDCCGTVDLFLFPSSTTTTGNGTSGTRGPEEDKKSCDATEEAPHEGLNIYIPSTIALSQPLLQRLRRKYTQIQRAGIAHGQGYVKGRRAVIKGFVEFLEHEWSDDD